MNLPEKLAATAIGVKIANRILEKRAYGSESLPDGVDPEARLTYAPAAPSLASNAINYIPSVNPLALATGYTALTSKRFPEAANLALRNGPNYWNDMRSHMLNAPNSQTSYDFVKRYVTPRLGLQRTITSDPTIADELSTLIEKSKPIDATAIAGAHASGRAPHLSAAVDNSIGEFITAMNKRNNGVGWGRMFINNAKGSAEATGRITGAPASLARLFFPATFKPGEGNPAVGYVAPGSEAAPGTPSESVPPRLAELTPYSRRTTGGIHTTQGLSRSLSDVSKLTEGVLKQEAGAVKPSLVTRFAKGVGSGLTHNNPAIRFATSGGVFEAGNLIANYLKYKQLFPDRPELVATTEIPKTVPTKK